MAQPGNKLHGQEEESIQIKEEHAGGSKRAGDTLNTLDVPSSKFPRLSDNSNADGIQEFDDDRLNKNEISNRPESPGSPVSGDPQEQENLAPQDNGSDSMGTFNQSQPKEKAYAENASQKPLTAFSLTDFLPENIPTPILSSRDEFKRILTKAVEVQLHMWQYDTQLSNLDLRSPAMYAENLEKDHSLLCDLAERVFCGLSEKGVETSEKVIFPIIDLKYVDEWNPILEKMLFKVKEAIVPLTGNKDKLLDSLLLLIGTLKQRDPQDKQEIMFEPLADLPKKLQLSPKAMKDRLQKLNLSSSHVVYYGEQSMHGKKTKEKKRKSAGDGQSHNSETSKPTSKSQGSQQNVCTSDIVKQKAVAGEATLSAYDYWGLESIHKEYRGKGTVIAVIDTGVNAFHPCLQNSLNPMDSTVKVARDFVNDNLFCIVDKCGHGTHCAGIACGQKFQGYTANQVYGTVPDGVAPEAKLISCKVTPDNSSDAAVGVIVKALRWLQHQKVDVVSISLGSLSFSKEIADEIADLVKQGIIIVSAASNHGHKFRQPICYPAALGNVLCIGSHDSHGKPSQFSPVGQQIHFLAPGEDIPGPESNNYSGIHIGHGTSCAAPAVAGLICLIIQCIRSKFPDYIDDIHNHWIVKEILREMSTNSGIHFDDRGYGALNPKPFFVDPLCSLKNALRESHHDLYCKLSEIDCKKKRQ